MNPGLLWVLFLVFVVCCFFSLSAIYIFKGTIFQTSTDSALWEDAGTPFANVILFFFLNVA